MTSLLIVLDLPPDVRQRYETEIRQRFPDLSVTLVDHHSKAGPYVADAEILLTFGVMTSDEMFDRGQKLKWVQAVGSGVDGIVDRAGLRAGTIVTNMQGIHGPPCAEAAFASMLALARDLPRSVRLQQSAHWERWPSSLLSGKTAVIVGLGVIAEALAPRCKAFGMTVVGVSRSTRRPEGFDNVLPREELGVAAALADHLIVLAPYSAETHGMIDAAVLAAMKPKTFLINVARGGLINEAALIAALQEKRIAAAALDVFEREPLPADSVLWSMSNVLITSHLAGFYKEYPDYALPVIEHNLRCYLDGEINTMVNVVRR